jgi:hypothetical protein
MQPFNCMSRTTVKTLRGRVIARHFANSSSVKAKEILIQVEDIISRMTEVDHARMYTASQLLESNNEIQ